MTMTQIVIGANYGDEGKGLMIDYLSSQAVDPTVIRFNGGAQATHTVVTPQGKRHAFSHFGSGTLAVASTYLSQFFLSNPILFRKEWEHLKIYNPLVTIHPDSLITTPIDMLINQYLEESRGDNRHGSCGLGIFQTVQRSRMPEFTLRYGDIVSGEATTIYNEIYFNYLTQQKLEELGINLFHFHQKYPISKLQAINKQFIEDTQFMRQNVLMNWNIPKDGTKIFEGAQGLMLDEDYGVWPHLTPSSCGLKNVTSLLGKEEEVEVIYTTRAYLTRHGSGPLNNECPVENISQNIVDETNIWNPYQQHIRYAPLDLDQLKSVIERDIKHLEGRKFHLSLAITCLDQMGETIPIYTKEKGVHSITKKNFTLFLMEYLAIHYVYESYGPSRATMKESRI